MILLPCSQLFWVYLLQVFCFSCVSCLENSFSICCTAGLLVLNSLNFCLSVKLLISPSNLNKNHAGQSILGYAFFPFITLNILCHSLLACRISVEKSADNLMGIPLYVICCFSLVAFNILIFMILIIVCLGVFLFGFMLLGTLSASWIGLIFLPCQGTFQLLSH